MAESPDLHSYYAEQAVNVSFRNISTRDELVSLAQSRSAFYADKFGLTPTYFNQLRMAEIGPDTGENALCFGLWGAKLDLVEPNQQAHAQIRNYFDTFGLTDQLQGLHGADLESFQADISFDFINAEGFVASIQPTSRWIDALDKNLSEHGQFLISYYERTGAFLEQFVNALGHLLAGASPLTHAQAVERIMQKKWSSMAHTRPFSAWYLDAMKNPFAQPAYQLDARTLLSDCLDAGFRLQASTPHYKDGLWVGWYKQIDSNPEYLERTTNFIVRNRLAYLLGIPCFWPGSAEHTVRLNQCLDELLSAQASVISDSLPSNAKAFSTALFALIEFLNAHAAEFYTTDNLAMCVTGLQQLQKACDFAIVGDADSTQQCVEQNDWFQKNWGTPVHFALFRRDTTNIAS